MSRLIEFRLDDGGQGTVLVEADDSIPAEGQTRVSTGGILAEQANKAFDNAMAGIRPIVSSVARQVMAAITDAQEIEVELGFKLTADAGVILARAAAEGHCKVAIKWVRKV
jgi:Trypsin-co-occurring domain 1